MLIKASLARNIGLPDPGSSSPGMTSSTGGWRRSKRTVVYVNAFVIRRSGPSASGPRCAPPQRFFRPEPPLRDAEPRPCGAVPACHGKFNRLGFGAGTVLTYLKEIVRLVLVERSIKGAGALWLGWRESRGILADRNWQPMPPVPAAAAPEQG